MMTDPIGDMLTRIRNAGGARMVQTRCPASRLKRSVAEVLKEAGYLSEVHLDTTTPHPTLVLGIRYSEEGHPLIEGLRRVSRPSRRVYVGKSEIPRVRHGLGMAILSTSRGVISDESAREASVGGEVLCEVW